MLLIVVSRSVRLYGTRSKNLATKPAFFGENVAFFTTLLMLIFLLIEAKPAIFNGFVMGLISFDVGTFTSHVRRSQEHVTSTVTP